MSPRIVSQDEWTKARLTLLAKEKTLTRQRDELARERRALPWVKIEKPYVFDGPTGKETLADLFEGRSQLAVYHFMLGPEWEEGEVRTYAKIVHDLLAWMARTLSLLWEYHEADLPGIRPVLEDWRYDFASQRWEDDVVKLRICNLFLAAERGK